MFGDFAAGGQLDAVDLRFTGVLVGECIHQDAGVFLLGAEHGCGQGQAVVEQVPFGAQFVVDGFFWLQVAGGSTGRQRVAVGTFAYQATGWRGRCGVRGVDAAVLHRLPDKAGLPVKELTVVLDLAAGFYRRARHCVGVGFGVKGVVAQAHVQQPFRIELDGIEHVRGAAGGFGVGAVVVAGDAAVPGIVGVWVAQ